VSGIRPLRALAEVALGRQRSPQYESGPHMRPYLRAANVKDGALDLDDVKEMNFSAREQQVFGLRTGDVLVSEGSGSLASVGASAVWNDEVPGACFQNTLIRLRPRSGVDPRFLAWWSRHAFADGLFASIASGANIFHLSAERVRRLPIRVGDMGEQRAIADFLDAETARIDALITKKQELASISVRRWSAELLKRLALSTTEDGAGPAWIPNDLPDGWTVLPLKRLISQSWSGDWGAEPGVLGNDMPCVRAADFEFSQLAARTGVVRSFDEAVRRTKALRPRDLVIEKSGGGENVSVGRVVAWHGETEAITTNFAAAMRPDPSHDPDFVLLAFRAAYEIGLPWRAIKQTTGLQNLDMSSYLASPWPVPPRREQERIASDMMDLLDATLGLEGASKRQIALLRERRQALITAAVTGEITVPGIAA